MHIVNHRRCKQQDILKDLPRTDILITFYNEAWSALLRTVHSILDRTPDNLVREILLIDDFSNLSKNMSDEIKNISV